MAVLYAYGYKPKARQTETPIPLGDLSTVGQGPDLFRLVADVLTGQPLADGEAWYQIPPKPPPAAEDPRRKWLQVTPGELVVDDAQRIIWGRMMMSRKGEAERKTKLATGVPTQYDEGDTGERPLFFLMSMPEREPEALLVLESARPYGMTSFWANELKKLITDRIPDGVFVEDVGRRTPKTKNVTLGWGPYGALETPEFIERYFDGTIDEAAASRGDHAGGVDEDRVVQIVRSSQVNKNRLANFVRNSQRREVAELMLPTTMVQALEGDPDEVKFRGRFAGREKLISMTRSRVSQPGVEVPPGSPRDATYPAYVSAEVMHELARDLVRLVGHDHEWVSEG